MSSRSDVPLLQSDSAGIQDSSFSLFTLAPNPALLEKMRFSAFVIASVFVSYVAYGMRHGMDDDKEEPDLWPKAIRVCSAWNMGLSRNEMYTRSQRSNFHGTGC